MSMLFCYLFSKLDKRWVLVTTPTRASFSQTQNCHAHIHLNTHICSQTKYKIKFKYFAPKTKNREKKTTKKEDEHYSRGSNNMRWRCRRYLTNATYCYNLHYSELYSKYKTKQNKIKQKKKKKKIGRARVFRIIGLVVRIYTIYNTVVSDVHKRSIYDETRQNWTDGRNTQKKHYFFFLSTAKET